MNEQFLPRLRLTDCVLVAQDGEQALAVLAQRCTRHAEADAPLGLLELQRPRPESIGFLEAYRVRPWPRRSLSSRRRRV